jgi:NAD(P)-dependent dehydrogenase (short-subunit alcohol dehydrogenase family)
VLNTDKIVLITGATGRRGGAVVRHMVSKGWRVRALTRHCSSYAAQRLAGQGVELLQGDLEESVTIRPYRIFRVKSQKLLLQHVYNRCHGHGSSWMTGVRLLGGIHAESPDCIYREGVDVRHTPKVRPVAGGNK